MRALAVILARGGSRGLPGKNLAPLGGRPLLAWTVDAGLGAGRVTRVVVSSDDPRILDAARDAGAEALQRPAELARDDTPSEPALLHAVEAAITDEDVVVLLQPTSPLRTAADVDAALARLESSGAEAVISVVEPETNPWKCFYEDADGRLRGIVDDETPFRPRQELPRALSPNGAIYAVLADPFRRDGRLFRAHTVAYLMPRARSVDVDSRADLELAERLLAAGPR